MSEDNVTQLVRAISEQLPQPLTAWPGGYPGEVEAALIDAVLSIRARYGSEATGVRGAVKRYRAAVDGVLDSMDRLADMDPGDLESTLAVRQRISGRSKSSAIVDAARSLVDAGAHHASDVDPQIHKGAYTRVHGLGAVTWEYFTMLLGRPGVKADVWIIRWVSRTVGSPQPLSSVECRRLLVAAHDRLVTLGDGEVPSLTQLDHAIWKHARSPV